MSMGLVVALGAFAPATSGSGTTFDESLDGAPRLVVKQPKLDSRLVRKAAIQSEVRVEIRARRPAAVRKLVAKLGGRVEGASGRLVEASLPAGMLSVLARDPSVRFAADPLRPVPDAVRGEGVAATGAAAWHAAGLRGAGVRVAVVDVGFAGWRRSRTNGDLPASTVAVDFCPRGAFEGPFAADHGTAVAEIVSEMAPAARLYLVCVQSVAALGQAETYAKRVGIHVVNHSASWFNSGRGDDTGGLDTPAGIVADARAAGILWVNAAGNRAQQHWSGAFADADGDGWHDFAPGDEGNTVLIPAGSRTCVALKWDGWPTTAVDYDLYLVREAGGTYAAQSTTLQGGNEPPTELACYTNGSSSAQADGVAIHGHEAPSSPRLDLFVYPGPDLEYQTPDGSVTEPGSASAALTVGAVCWQTDALEAFSSRGPTIDGRAKPDLTGPDWVSSYAYGLFGGCGGPKGFAGTSASAPHVAGAAALVKGANPTFGPAELEQYLESHAVDLGMPGHDMSFGSGKLALGPAPRSALRACVVPRVGGLRLGAAQAAIVRAGCSVGRVAGARSRVHRGRVVAQSPSAGRTLASRARVHLTVSRGRR
jgi:subtilisin family serine protease